MADNPQNGESQLNSQEVNQTLITLRRIPPLSYTLQNIMISMSTVMSSMASLLVTVSVFLPMSLIRVFLPLRMLSLSATAGPKAREVANEQSKVILIIGASRGIGRSVVKQYIMEENTTIIAVSKSIDKLRDEVGKNQIAFKAKICFENLDLSSSSEILSKAINDYDRKYGPITHMYAISGISNHLDKEKAWGLDATCEMINVNVTGTVSVVLATYERMKTRQYGKICIVGSVAGLYNPANMISYASTKSFINTFSTSLRVLAAPCNIDVVTVEPGFIKTRMTDRMRGQGSTLPEIEFQSPEGMARAMKKAVEKGGVGVVSWPVRQSVLMYALRGINPICEELGRWLSLKSGMAGKKIT